MTFHAGAPSIYAIFSLPDKNGHTRILFPLNQGLLFAPLVVHSATILPDVRGVFLLDIRMIMRNENGKSYRRPLLTAALACLVIASCASPSFAGNNAAASYPGLADPWRDVNLSFSRPGRITRIAVRRGQVVKAGQWLAAENDQPQLLARRLARLNAQSTLRIQAAQAQLAQDQVALSRTQWAAKQKAATPFEVQRAKLRVVIDGLTLKLAELKHQHDKLTLQAAELAVQRREIKAPFNGVIEDRFVDSGKSVNAFKKVLEIVQINRLRVFVPVPLPAAMRLRPGGRAIVDSPKVGIATGKIIWIAGVADSASNTLMVEVRVKNSRGLPAGRQVLVRFPTAKVVDAAGNAAGKLSGVQPGGTRP